LQLIKATIKSIDAYGLSNVTVGKVAALAGLSQGIVNFHFNGKSDLLLSTLKYVIDEYYDAMEVIFSSKNDPIQILTSVIEYSFEPQLCDLEKIVAWYAFQGECTANSAYADLCRESDQAFRSNLLTVIASMDCFEEKNARSSLAISRALGGVIEDHWLEYLLNPESFDHAVAKQTCFDFLDAFFPGQFSIQTASIHAKASKRPEIAESLAPWTYHNQEFFELENELIFRKSWLIAGHISDLPNAGDYLTFDAVGERALIIRGQEGQIRAFHNVCRHRGAKVLGDVQGNCPGAIMCRFHGWSYNPDGTVRHIPRADTFTGLDERDNGLVKLDVEIWFGFVFINFSEGAKSLAETLSGVADQIAPYMTEKMQPLPNTKYRNLRPQNWKITHDIDNEGYHVPVGHPSLQQLYGKSYSDRTINNVSVSSATINEKQGKLWSVRHYQNILPRFDHLPEENQRLWLYIGISPSIVIGIYPDMVEYYMSVPKSISESHYIGGAYGLPDARREVKLSRYLTQRINQTTEQEDEQFVNWIQEGIHSSVFPTPKLSSLEQGVSSLHREIQEIIPVASLPNAPAVGELAAINQRFLSGE
jgi:phenylpropionate dioxygenase-like ring-hydroxylating dioxygenase large terminal subunit/AcrR family transcriptional regulator